MTRVLIIEDEQSASRRLEKMLLAIDPELQIVDRLESIQASVEWFKTHTSPDLIMLDIQLADGQSFEIFRQVEIQSFVIFTTAYDEFAIKAFELNSIDYLLKPVDEDKLRKSLEKFNALRKSAVPVQMDELLALFDGSAKMFKKRFLVNVGPRIRSVEVSDVSWFVSAEKATFLCTRDDYRYPVEFSLDQLTDILDPDLFFRISRQYIIRFDSIRAIHILSKSRIKLEIDPDPGEEILVSTSRTPHFRKWLDR